MHREEVDREHGDYGDQHLCHLAPRLELVVQGAVGAPAAAAVGVGVAGAVAGRPRTAVVPRSVRRAWRRPSVAACRPLPPPPSPPAAAAPGAPSPSPSSRAPTRAAAPPHLGREASQAVPDRGAAHRGGTGATAGGQTKGGGPRSNIFLILGKCTNILANFTLA